MDLRYNKIKKGGGFVYKSKMMIVMRRDLKMRKGKIAAQAGHACIAAILMALNKEGRMNDFEMTPDGFNLKATDKTITPLSDWFLYGWAKVCVYVDSEEELLSIAQKASEKGIIASVITDAGMTEFHGVPIILINKTDEKYEKMMNFNDTLKLKSNEDERTTL